MPRGFIGQPRLITMPFEEIRQRMDVPTASDLDRAYETKEM